MPKVPKEELEKLRQNLLEDSQSDLDYIFLTVASCLIATCGLLLGSPAAIVGAMIVAPLMQPLRGLALGALEGDLVLFRRSTLSTALGASIAIGLSWLVGRVVGIPETEFSGEILARTQPNLVDLGIAMTAGAVAGFAKIRPKLSDALAGTAIAVALMPPLCVVGLGLSVLTPRGFEASQGAFILYLTNLLGITLACMLVFVWGGYYIENSKITRAISSTVALTIVLLVPLALSLWELLRQVQLRATLKDILLRRTITVGQQVELLDTKINWKTEPPEVYLQVRVRPNDPLTPLQVSEVQKLVNHQMRQPFILIFDVEQSQEIRAEERDLMIPPAIAPVSSPTSPTTPEPPQEPITDLEDPSNP
ncbi:DUF389 domain-containing protein [Oscillatoriales cyanobacterium LEGE 11467]|uniref:DUF389 domain-containing protein n=1 Tax=Zarconia navalis LEGE 11467 TaxID=1828826 RepID=A0A928VZ16_9CYAN|nr:DUF389 domain-containing protein [Zarconia navalis]MBE9040290.1 DUF389 domain-containing protein [Zarconia navalis LEGE 11467]